MYKNLNILLSSDNNYAQHMGALIQSIIEHNNDFTRIIFFVINNNISEQSIIKINKIVDSAENAIVYYIDFSTWASKLKLNMQWPISISSYARLFVDEMIPKEIDKILYLDCDMIVCKSLSSLWHTDMGIFPVGAVQDMVSINVKGAVGLTDSDRYFNAGLLLINLNEWRKQKLGRRCQTFLEEHNGSVKHHDQGTLNGVLRNNWYRLPNKFNVTTVNFILNYKQSLHYYQENSDYYSEQEVLEAKSNPTILHFTPSFTPHPWVKGCLNPYKQLYWVAINKTPWKGCSLEPDRRKWYVRLVELKIRLLYKYFKK